jgi:O-antigen/teichoic acid export membrane protein
MNQLKRWSFAPIIQNFFNLGIFQASGIALQLLVIPIITRKYGIATFGQVALAASFAAFIASVTNYGTSQTAVKEVAGNTDDTIFLSKLFYKILIFRLFASVIFFPVLVLMLFLHPTLSIWVWVGAIPLILAEIVNPLYFLIGKEKIQWISWGNIGVKVLVLALIILIPLQSQQAAWINGILGIPIVIYYVFICLYIHHKESLQVILPSRASLMQLARENFYIMFNSTAVSLQQSVFLFTVANYVSANTLGMYALIDKLLGVFRQLISSFSNAVYPQAARLFLQSPSNWFQFKKTLQKMYAILFGLMAVAIFFGAKLIVVLITKKDDPATEVFVQMFSLAPLLMALNANNVLTLLLEKRHRTLFIISMLILAITFLISYLFVQFTDHQALGWYPVVIESCCLLIYMVFTNKKSLHAP